MHIPINDQEVIENDQEANADIYTLKINYISYYNSSLNESFSNILGTTWLLYDNKNTGEGQFGKEPIMSVYFNPKTQKVLLTFYQIDNHFSSYDCLFNKTNYSMFLSAKDAKMTFSFRMLSPSTMRSTDGSMILHKVANFFK